jgi:drug/metabolite transporter (DMT)-like permease
VNNRIAPYIELSTATIIAGSSVVIGKLMSNTIPIFLSQGISLIFALLVLIPATIRIEGRLPKISGSDFPFIFLQALLGMFLFRVFLLNGLKYTSAVESGIITGTTPAVTAVLSFLFLKEKAVWNKIAGIVVAVAGVIIINLVGAGSVQKGLSGTMTGNLLVFLAVIGEALLTIFRKKTSSKISPLAGAAYVTLFAFVMFLPVSAVEALKFDFSEVGRDFWIFTSYYGVIVTAAAYILWFKGVSGVQASTAAVYTGCMPVSALVLSLIILKESISPLQLAGIILIIAGIVFVSDFKFGRVSCSSMENTRQQL